MNFLIRLFNTETFVYTLLFLFIEAIAIGQVIKTGIITVSIGAFIVSILVLIGYILHIALRMDEEIFKEQAKKLEKGNIKNDNL